MLLGRIEWKVNWCLWLEQFLSYFARSRPYQRHQFLMRPERRIVLRMHNRKSNAEQNCGKGAAQITAILTLQFESVKCQLHGAF